MVETEDFFLLDRYRDIRTYIGFFFKYTYSTKSTRQETTTAAIFQQNASSRAFPTVFCSSRNDPLFSRNDFRVDPGFSRSEPRFSRIEPCLRSDACFSRRDPLLSRKDFDFLFSRRNESLRPVAYLWISAELLPLFASTSMDHAHPCSLPFDALRKLSLKFFDSSKLWSVDEFSPSLTFFSSTTSDSCSDRLES